MEFTFQPLDAERLDRAAEAVRGVHGGNLYARSLLAAILDDPERRFWLLTAPGGEIAGYIYFFLADLPAMARLSVLGADLAFGVFWKPRGRFPMGRTLAACGFRSLGEARRVWYDRDDLVCPYCQGRCVCLAEVAANPLQTRTYHKTQTLAEIYPLPGPAGGGAHRGRGLLQLPKLQNLPGGDVRTIVGGQGPDSEAYERTAALLNTLKQDREITFLSLTAPDEDNVTFYIDACVPEMGDSPANQLPYGSDILYNDAAGDENDLQNYITIWALYAQNRGTDASQFNDITMLALRYHGPGPVR